MNLGSTVPRRSDSSTKAVVAERRRKAIELRQMGVDTVTIGRQLGYGVWRPSATKPDGEPLPLDQREQVSTDAVIGRMVRQDVERALAERRHGLDETIDTMRAAMTERLERLHTKAYAEALKGDWAAMREARALNAQIIHLWALNKPIRVDLGKLPDPAEVEGVVLELVQLAERSTADSAPPVYAVEA